MDINENNKFKDNSFDRVENVNNNITMLIRPKTLFELEDAIKKYADTREIHDKFSGSNDEEIELYSYISRGIDITNFYLKDSTIATISDFLSGYGYSKEFAQERFEDISLFTSDIEFLHHGKLVSFGNKIGIDFSFLDFDKDGKFQGIKEGYDEFLKYTTAHEFFHKLSGSSNSIAINMTNDGLSEGFTELFAHMTTGNANDKSDLYDFPEKVCTLFSEMVGMNQVLDDYIFHLDTCPNLVNMFQECGFTVDDFKTFRQDLSAVISVSTFDRKQGKPVEQYGIETKSRCLEFLQNNLIAAYCELHPDKSEKVTTSFNNLFADYGVKVESHNENLDNKSK